MTSLTKPCIQMVSTRSHSLTGDGHHIIIWLAASTTISHHLLLSLHKNSFIQLSICSKLYCGHALSGQECCHVLPFHSLFPLPNDCSRMIKSRYWPQAFLPFRR